MTGVLACVLSSMVFFSGSARAQNTSLDAGFEQEWTEDGLELEIQDEAPTAFGFNTPPYIPEVIRTHARCVFQDQRMRRYVATSSSRRTAIRRARTACMRLSGSTCDFVGCRTVQL